MNDSCTCCCNCSSRWSSVSYKNSFSKKLLIAVSVVIIITMCLTPAEARSVEHRRRHQRRPDMAQLTKDEYMKRSKNPSTEQFKNATRKIKHKLRNTKRFFDQDRKVLNETREYRDGMPGWLPAVNFVNIHSHKTSRKVGKSITEQKFTYLMPKLYKSLKEYEVIFNLLRNVQLDLSDDPFTNYVVVRKKLLTDTLEKLHSTILEIQDNMLAVNMQIPPFDKNRMKLEALKKKVDATQCLKNDYIAFRGYGNLLNNWYCEFRFSKNQKNKKGNKCAHFNEKIEARSSKVDKRDKSDQNN